MHALNIVHGKERKGEEREGGRQAGRNGRRQVGLPMPQLSSLCTPSPCFFAATVKYVHDVTPCWLPSRNLPHIALFAPPQERKKRQPSPTVLLRMVSCFYGTTIKYASEVGRVQGHRARHGLLGACCRLLDRFDWFGGFIPSVPAKEKACAARRLLVYLSAATGAVAIAVEKWG